jgi:hypothetical protein
VVGDARVLADSLHTDKWAYGLLLALAVRLSDWMDSLCGASSPSGSRNRKEGIGKTCVRGCKEW